MSVTYQQNKRKPSLRAQNSVIGRIAAALRETNRTMEKAGNDRNLLIFIQLLLKVIVLAATNITTKSSNRLQLTKKITTRALVTVFDDICKRRRQKYAASHRIFNSLLGK